MTKTFISILALAALATPAAAADSINISLAGKTPEAIHAEVTRAARTLCYDLYGAYPLGPTMTQSCIRESVARAEAQIGLNLAKAAPPSKLAAAQ